MTMNHEDLVYQVAVVIHDTWKQFAHPLLLGGHLTVVKSVQYDRGMCSFDELEPYYQNSYITQARDLVQLCLEYVEEMNPKYPGTDERYRQLKEEYGSE